MHYACRQPLRDAPMHSLHCMLLYMHPLHDLPFHAHGDAPFSGMSHMVQT